MEPSQSFFKVVVTIKRFIRGKELFGKQKKRQGYKTVHIIFVNE